MDIISLIINLISGAVGGNIAGSVLKDQSLGTMGNSIAGILGGGIGAAILQALGGSAGAGGGWISDPSSVTSSAVVWEAAS